MTNTCITNHVQPGKKCYMILFMCLCVVTLLIVYFETRTLIKLKTSWGVTVSGFHMDETSKEALQTTVNNGSIPPLKLCQRNTFQVSNIKDNVTADHVKNATVLSRVQKGGIYKPRDCKPIDSVAIIIPYRDREKQLEIFINYMHAFLQRQQLQYGIFVVELARPTTFNRGILANVGFLAAQSTGLYNCYVIHDVDLFPLNDRNTYSCSNQFRHLSIENSKYKKGLPYSTYVGGVVAMKEATYMKMNGFSNLYFGWGGEDDDLEIRIKMAKFKLERPDKKVGIYKALPHGQDKMNQLNENRWKLLKATKTQWQSDGVNSLNYQTLSYKEDVLYTLIYVKAKQSDILNTTVIVTIDGVKIYESDLLTIRNKGKINTKIINAYLYLLHTQSDGKLLRVKYQFKFLKPELPKYSNSSGTEFIFIPVKISGSWCLIVIYTKQYSIDCLDPTGTRSSTQKTAEMGFIRNLYHKQFGIELQEITINKQNILYPESQYDSGLIIMMFAKALLKGKSLFFQQVDIDGARTVIESTLRQK